MTMSIADELRQEAAKSTEEKIARNLLSGGAEPYFVAKNIDLDIETVKKISNSQELLKKNKRKIALS